MARKAEPPMRIALATGLILSLPAGNVGASTMVATRPGLMCKLPQALPILTMSDGSNRGDGSHAHSDDSTTNQQGGCIDIPQGSCDVVH